MTKDTALTLALEALEKARRQIQHASPVAPHSCIGEAIRAIREALAAPQGEPVAWLITAPNVMPLVQVHKPIAVLSNETVQPLYTAHAPLSEWKLLAITTAYEQGVGKGMKRTDFNPYTPGCDEAKAWQLGYDEGMDKAPAPLSETPDEWSVFNTGAEVASGLSYSEAMEYMTPDRIERGWTAVCVLNKDNIERHVRGEQ